MPVQDSTYINSKLNEIRDETNFGGNTKLRISNIIRDVYDTLVSLVSNVDNTSDADKPVSTAQAAADAAVLEAAQDYADAIATSKQDTLVSGTNIKTINGNSLLGSGNIVIAGGSSTNEDSYNAGGELHLYNNFL